jgi:hypothetical protein
MRNHQNPAAWTCTVQTVRNEYLTAKTFRKEERYPAICQASTGASPVAMDTAELMAGKNRKYRLQAPVITGRFVNEVAKFPNIALLAEMISRRDCIQRILLLHIISKPISPRPNHAEKAGQQ